MEPIRLRHYTLAIPLTDHGTGQEQLRLRLQTQEPHGLTGIPNTRAQELEQPQRQLRQCTLFLESPDLHLPHIQIATPETSKPARLKPPLRR
jgi:hypothetical protein